MLWDPRLLPQARRMDPPVKRSKQARRVRRLRYVTVWDQVLLFIFEYGKDDAKIKVLRIEMLASPTDYGVCSRTFRNYTS